MLPRTTRLSYMMLFGCGIDLQGKKETGKRPQPGKRGERPGAARGKMDAALRACLGIAGAAAKEESARVGRLFAHPSSGSRYFRRVAATVPGWLLCVYGAASAQAGRMRWW